MFLEDSYKKNPKFFTLSTKKKRLKKGYLKIRRFFQHAAKSAANNFMS
jgi:hypothetical protein